MNTKYSVVENLPHNTGGSCGYCKSSDTNYSHGMWAHTLSVEDYQDLIDRGWRRSGQYCYKPSLTVTCCPLYTIKCDALNLKLSKSQKKLLKKVSKYLNEGSIGPCKESKEYDSDGSSSETEPSGSNIYDKRMNKIIEEKSAEEAPTLKDIDVFMENDHSECRLADKPVEEAKPQSEITEEIEKLEDSVTPPTNIIQEKKCLKTPRPGLGRDTSKPACKKAKLIRLEKKKRKLEEKGLSLETIEKKITHEKTLEDFINESNNENSLNKLELRTVRSGPQSKEFQETFELEHALYQKYQVTVHGDPVTKCTANQFTRFLVSSPLKAKKLASGPPSGYGSFHQQYWLNGKLIAVGVVDILPKCVSSVYFFYDPDYSYLSLGTYGSLRELEFVRSLQKVAPEISNYYMGYYIHTCPKMRYKARFSPSYLLCPEVYTWHPIPDCQRKLDQAKYSRFNDDIDAICEDSNINLNRVLVLWSQVIMPYSSYKMRKKGVGIEDDEEVKEYAELVGRKCAERMLLYRPS